MPAWTGLYFGKAFLGRGKIDVPAWKGLGTPDFLIQPQKGKKVNF
mgnify:CR=1 FL=1